MALPFEKTLLPQVIRVHDAVYQKTNGWIGHRLLGIPSLLLHTVGAKTGKARSASLTYARDGDDYLIVASKGGDPKAPGWYHNLKANPSVEINVGPKRFARDGPSGAARRRGLPAAVADRQQEQQQPLRGVPGEDVATDSGRPAQARLIRLLLGRFPAASSLGGNLEQLFGQ